MPPAPAAETRTGRPDPIHGKLAERLGPSNDVVEHPGGPFASDAVAEDLDELRRNVLKQIGKVSVPRTLERPHRALQALLRADERRREKIADSRYPNWELSPIFDIPEAARKLRIAHALMSALSGLGHACKLGGGDTPSFHATIGDQNVRVKIHHPGTETATYRRHGDDLPPPAKTPLTIELFPDLPDGFPRHWQDDGDKLESKLADVAAAVIAAGEARYRLGIAERLAHVARVEARHEEQRQEALARRNKERLAALHRSAEMLRQANDLRALIATVGSAIENGQRHLDQQAIAEWKLWATAEADRLDPVISGQVDDHLLSSRTRK